jgi:hypothetical protein
VLIPDRVPTGWSVPLAISQGASAASVDVRVVQ